MSADNSEQAFLSGFFDRPPVEDWQTLCRKLLVISKIDREDTRAGTESEKLAAAWGTLKVLFEYLSKSQVLMSEGALLPMLRVVEAVGETKDGKVAKLFIIPQKKNGARGKSHQEASIQGFSARALNELVLSGETQQIAVRKVINAIRKGKVKGWESIREKNIVSWKDKCNAGDTKAISPRTLGQFNFPIPDPPPPLKNDHTHRANFLLTVLASGSVRD